MDEKIPKGARYLYLGLLEDKASILNCAKKKEAAFEIELMVNDFLFDAPGIHQTTISVPFKTEWPYVYYILKVA